MTTENKFQSLTPSDTIDLHHYQEAVDYVFSSNDIRNIALTGSYGSGKSSVIRSYEKTHKERSFIHISLARFEEQGQPADSPADYTKTVNVLEGKIINQLLHQIPEKNLPPSYTRPKGRVSWICHGLMVLTLLALVVTGIYVVQFQKWVSAVERLDDSWIKPLLLSTTNPYGRLLGIVLFLLLICGVIFYTLRTYPFRISFTKVDLNGLVGIELFNAEEDTYFDKYLHNVLYLFDQADADAIVFEDLDRYDVTLIFEKLREISDLAYSREKRGLRPGKKPLRFFYLIRDDVFTASDRSKFFDFIIPVVPFVDASNSCDQLLERFEKAGFEGLFTKRFLQDVSLYLGDMRLVSNIVNEFIVYHGRLSGSGLATKPDRQLAMVIYKNLYPGDFDLLQKGRGYVYELFEQKKKFLDAKKAEECIDSKIQELRQCLDDAEKESLKSIDELNALYFPLTESGIIIDGTPEPNLSRAELIRQILEKPNAVKYTRYIQGYSYPRAIYNKDTSVLPVTQKKVAMEADVEYIRRKTLIENQGAQRQRELLEEIWQLQEYKAKFATMSLKEILLDLGPDDETNFWSPELPSYEPENYLKKIQNSKNFGLLKYLVRNGYIDENYAAYISYFYPNSLTAQDRNFLLSIADRAPLPPDYHLDRPDTVLDRLENADFFRQEVRNYDLLVHLLATNDPNLPSLLQSGTEDEHAHQFFAAFWRKERHSIHASRFICTLYQEHPEWFRMWCEDTRILLGGEWRLFILDTFRFLPLEGLAHINSGNWLTEKISTDSQFLQLDHPVIPQLIPALETLNVRFARIDYRGQDIPLVRDICQKNLYQLNLPMLKTNMRIFWDIPSGEVESCSYSHIRRHPEEPLFLRVLEDMDTYADAILHQADTRFSDSEDAAIAFLNCETLSEHYKEEYVWRSDTVLEDINTVNSTLWTVLLESRCAAYTWENMADYFAKFSKDTDCLPPELADFINGGSGPLGWDYDKLNQRIEDLADKLRQSVLVSEVLDLERYQTALEGMTFAYSNGPFPFHDLSDERMKIVLKLGIVPITVDNTEVIRKHYPQLWKDFILPDSAEELAELVESGEIQLTESELASLLEDSRMGSSAAEKMLRVFSGTISLQDRSFPTDIRICIVETHLDAKDVPFLLKTFAQEPDRIQSAFLNYVKEHADSLVDTAEHIQFIPVEVYVSCLNTLTEDQLLALRPYMPNTNFDLICVEDKKLKFPDTLEVRKILSAFKNYRWISSWKSKDGQIIAYPTKQ